MIFISNYLPYLENLLDVILIYYFISRLIKRRGHLLYIILAVFLQSLANTYINASLGMGTPLGFMIMFGTTVFILFLPFREKLYRIIIIAMIGMVLMGLTELIAGQLIIVALKIPPSAMLENNIFRLYGIILSKTLFFIITRYISPKFSFLSKIKRRHAYTILLIALSNIIIIFTAIVLYRFTGEILRHEMLYFLAVGTGAILFSLLMLFIMRKMVEYHQKEISWKMKEKEYKNLFFYIKNIEDIINRLKAQRHDFNNFISTLYGLIHLGHYEQAKKYILTLTEEISVTNEMIDNENPIISALLSMKKEKAKAYQIAFDDQVYLPLKLPLNDIDITIILGNLIDNAIEACQKVEEIDRKIAVALDIQENMLIMKISNSKSSKDKFEKMQRFTNKSNQEDHGFGLFNVSQIIENYKGLLKVTDNGNEFRVNVAIPVKTDERQSKQDCTK